MPGYNVEVFVHEEGDDTVYKVVWVANYSDAPTAIETAARRALGIAKYMKDTGAGVNNLGGVTYDKTKVFEKKVSDVSGNLKTLENYMEPKKRPPSESEY